MAEGREAMIGQKMSKKGKGRGGEKVGGGRGYDRKGKDKGNLRGWRQEKEERRRQRQSQHG